MTPQSSNRRRLPPALRWLAIPLLLAVLAFAWWTISPLFLNTRVDEAFPVAASAPSAAAMTDTMAQPTGAAMTNTMAQPTGAAMTNTMVEPTAAAATDTAAQPTTAPATTQPAVAVASTAAPAPTEVPPPTAAPAPTEVPPPTAAPAPIALTSGSFTRVDALHSAEGTATIYQLPDGSRVLRLENFAAQNGPDLYVSLSGHPMPRSNAETFDSGYIELERLKANQGNQNYALPADLDLASFKSVVIWCKAFSVVFSTAELVEL